MEDNKLPKYPDLERISLVYPSPQVLLGEEIYWTEKRDGSQLRIALVNGELQIATRHQESSEQFKKYFETTEQATGIKELLKDSNGFSDNPAANFNTGAVIFGEILCKGKSPARFEHHEKHEFIIFDIYSQRDQRFISYTAMYQQAFHYALPVVECWALSKHQTMESFYLYRDDILKIAKEKGREGTVLKCYHNQIFAKEKLDTPIIQKVDIEDGSPKLPALPDSEVMGAVAKAHADLGEAFMDKKLAMPLVARYISEEMGKHLCSKPCNNFFSYYTEYIKGLEC